MQNVPHQLRGNEIYKVRSIFYSLGDFVMMNNSLDDVPADMYDQLKVEPGSVATPELLRARNEKEFLHPNLYETVIATSSFRDNHLIRIELHPADLGVNDKSASRGVPHIAAPSTAKRILKQI